MQLLDRVVLKSKRCEHIKTVESTNAQSNVTPPVPKLWKEYMFVAVGFGYYIAAANCYELARLCKGKKRI